MNLALATGVAPFFFLPRAKNAFEPAVTVVDSGPANGRLSSNLVAFPRMCLSGRWATDRVFSSATSARRLKSDSFGVLIGLSK
ncbi:hypothetical protein F5Y02DRAFT_399074 [Annulohypoxylon stygium]|nr:hypothetical protein F5Y02DRAFT_399074 [Annulohypoxylon stygium]